MRVQVGAQTETELKEKKLRVEDALNATKASLEEGIVVGGGCALVRLAGAVEEIKEQARSFLLTPSFIPCPCYCFEFAAGFVGTGLCICWVHWYLASGYIPSCT